MVLLVGAFTLVSASEEAFRLGCMDLDYACFGLFAYIPASCQASSWMRDAPGPRRILSRRLEFSGSNVEVDSSLVSRRVSSGAAVAAYS